MDKVDITPAFLYWIANYAKEYLCDGRSIRCGLYDECPFEKFFNGNESVKCSELGLSQLLDGLREIYDTENRGL